MYYRGYDYSPAGMCPYCGGMHSPGQCPMMMYPPAMPMPCPPMPMPPVECPPYPMPDMAEAMKMLQHISCRVDEIYRMCKEMYMKKAKG